jgi:hypothetical protein
VNALIAPGRLAEAESELQQAHAIAVRDPNSTGELRACDLALRQLSN